MRRAALFDVDGTLVDTNYLHTTAWAEALRQCGHHIPMAAVHRAIGLPSGDLIEHLTGKTPEDETKTQLSAAHKALYAPHFERLHAFHGAARLLRTLAGKGWVIVLVTSASGEELEALRRAIDADDVIAQTASADDVDEGKPAPDPVHKALGLVGAPAEGSVFVGDSVWDVRAAGQAGIPCVALLSGGIPRAELEEAGAAVVYQDTADLLDRLDESPLGVREDQLNESPSGAREESTVSGQDETVGEQDETPEAVPDDNLETGLGQGGDDTDGPEHPVPGGELPQGPGERAEAVPRDLPDQQAREGDPWDLHEPGTSSEDDDAAPGPGDSGTDPGEEAGPEGAQSEQPKPDEPSA